MIREITFMLAASAADQIGSADQLGIPKVTLDGGIASAINLLLFISGAVSMIFVVVGGLYYALSAGDPGKIKSAKDTIFYALIGLIVSLMAYAIINYIFVSL